MARESSVAVLSKLSEPSLGVFRGCAAVDLGVSRKRLRTLVAAGVLTRELTDTYRMTAVAPSTEQTLRAALLWAGPDSAAAGRSAGWLYGVEDVTAESPEIVVARSHHTRSPLVVVRRPENRAVLMIREYKGIRVTGVEATLVALAAELDEQALEVACEDACRRRLTSIPALRSYLRRFGRHGVPGVAPMRALVAELDPRHPSRSKLEVRTRRLLVASGMRDFVREFPLEWNGRTYRYDFAFERSRTILETNGKRWHDDPADYEHDNEKWSVPGRYGYRVVFATWGKVTRHPGQLLQELRTTMAA